MNHFYPYNSFESDPHLLAILLKEQKIDSVKVRELSILDVLKLCNNIINEEDIGHKTDSTFNFFILWPVTSLIFVNEIKVEH